MGRKYSIQVKDSLYPEEVKIIERVLRSEAIGNFNPIFCHYLGKDYLVQSELGDLSDPFRSTKKYLDYLYIEI